MLEKNRAFLFPASIIIFCIFVGALFSSLILGYVPFLRTRHNTNFERELNIAIINLVEQVVDIQYRTHCLESLELIFTEELMERYDDAHPNFFRNETFFFVNRNYMRTLHYADDDRWYVNVRIHEGPLRTVTSFFLQIAIVRCEDHSYKIDFIGRG